jgi:hypothetical protein
MAAPYPLPYWFTAEKPPGRFSRRHPDEVENATARVLYKFNRGPQARRRRANERAACTLPKSHSAHECNGGAS